VKEAESLSLGVGEWMKKGLGPVSEFPDCS